MDTGAVVGRREMLRGLSSAIAAAAIAPWRGAGSGRAQPVAPGVKMPLPPISATEREKLNFFSPQEKEMIANVAELVIPTDEGSPGARAAGVQDWIDFIVANSPAAVQKQWRAGLAAMDQFSLEVAGKKFLELEAAGQQKLLEQLAEREDSPRTPSECFFALAKEATVKGYYTSEIGLLKDLRYQGGSYVAAPDVTCPAVKDRRQ